MSFLFDNSKTLLTTVRCIHAMRGGPSIHWEANRIAGLNKNRVSFILRRGTRYFYGPFCHDNWTRATNQTPPHSCSHLLVWLSRHSWNTWPWHARSLRMDGNKGEITISSFFNTTFQRDRGSYSGECSNKPVGYSNILTLRNLNFI